MMMNQNLLAFLLHMVHLPKNHHHHYIMVIIIKAIFIIIIIHYHFFYFYYFPSVSLYKFSGPFTYFFISGLPLLFLLLLLLFLLFELGGACK